MMPGISVAWRPRACHLRQRCTDGPHTRVRYLDIFGMTDPVRQQHDRLAGVYDRRWGRYIARTLTFLKTWASITPRAAVLDIGCGTGEFERLVLRDHPEQRMVGVDLSVKMLEVARQKCQAYPNVTFCTASAAALPFPDYSFDVVVSASALHYFDQPEMSLKEMRRVLKPGGSAVIMDWCKDYFLCRLLDIALKLIGRPISSAIPNANFIGYWLQRSLTSSPPGRCDLGWFGD